MNLSATILLIVSVLGCWTVVLILRSISEPANKVLGLAILMLAFMLASGGLSSLFFFSSLSRLNDGLLLMFVASFYNYVRNTIESKPFVAGDLVHYIPAALFLSNFASLNFVAGNDRLVTTYDWLATIPLLPDLYGILKFLVCAVYWSLQVRLLWKFYGEDLRSRQVQTKSWRNWVVMMVGFESLSWMPALAGVFLNASSAAHYMGMLAIVLMILLTLEGVIRKREILDGLKHATPGKASLSERALLTTLGYHEVDATSSRSLAVENGAQVLEQLSELMDEDRPYLLPAYSLEDLSRELGMKPKQVNALLLEIIGLPFPDYMDQQRVFHCQQRMKEGSFGSLSLDEVASACGFKDRTSFNAAFKKYTSTDPQTYLKFIKRGRQQF